MQRDSKLSISPEELAILNNTGFFVVKQAITSKIYSLFEMFTGKIQSLPIHRQFPFPKGCDAISPKISKGENFKGLPYIILDYPRQFAKDDVFAFRTMMWWGRYFSFTLHLSGISKQTFSNNFVKNLSQLYGKNYFFSLDDDEWNHDMTNNGYIPIERSNEGIIQEKCEMQNYLKITSRMNLEDWDNLPETGAKVYTSFLESLL